ncbi:MAG TPA: hypothetical protein V6C69_14375 [Trichormus sp.]|jgi:hypothetical protein
MTDPQEQKEGKSNLTDTAGDTKEGADFAAKKRAILEYGNTSDSLSTIVKSGQSDTNQLGIDSSGSVSMDHDEIKWERDVFRDVLSNVNQTLRFQIQMAVPLLAACVTVLNLVPPQSHQELLNDLDRWVFIPVLISVAIAYRGLEFHWYSDSQRTKLSQDIKELYKLVKYKHRMVKMAILLQALGLVLLMVFVLLEYR